MPRGQGVGAALARSCLPKSRSYAGYIEIRASTARRHDLDRQPVHRTGQGGIALRQLHRQQHEDIGPESATSFPRKRNLQRPNQPRASTMNAAGATTSQDGSAARAQAWTGCGGFRGSSDSFMMEIAVYGLPCVCLTGRSARVTSTSWCSGTWPFAGCSKSCSRAIPDMPIGIEQRLARTSWFRRMCSPCRFLKQYVVPRCQEQISEHMVEHAARMRGRSSAR